MTTVHDIFKSQFISASFNRKVSSVPWFNECPLGHWDKDGELIEFSILANLVTGGNTHLGAGKAKALGIEGTPAIVPLKEQKINAQTGERYSAWKYVKSVALRGFFSEAEAGPGRYDQLIENMKLDVDAFDSDIEAFNFLYFYFMNKLGCDKALKLESFIAEVAAAYGLLRHGIRVPEAYMPAQRLADWASILRGGDDKVLTIIGTRAQSLLR